MFIYVHIHVHVHMCVYMYVYAYTCITSYIPDLKRLHMDHCSGLWKGHEAKGGHDECSRTKVQELAPMPLCHVILTAMRIGIIEEAPTSDTRYRTSLSFRNLLPQPTNYI